MSKAWLKVIFGAFCEVIWVIGMKHSTTWWEILGTVIAIFISFYALIKAGEELPVGTAYAVFVGLGSLWNYCNRSFFIPHTIGHRKSSFSVAVINRCDWLKNGNWK